MGAKTGGEVLPQGLLTVLKVQLSSRPITTAPPGDETSGDVGNSYWAKVSVGKSQPQKCKVSESWGKVGAIQVTDPCR